MPYCAGWSIYLFLSCMWPSDVMHACGPLMSCMHVALWCHACGPLMSSLFRSLMYTVSTAYTAVVGIYPELIFNETNNYPFLNYQDRRVGKSGQYLLDNSLTYTGDEWGYGRWCTQVSDDPAMAVLFFLDITRPRGGIHGWMDERLIGRGSLMVHKQLK